MLKFQLDFISNKKIKRWLIILGFLEKNEIGSAREISSLSDVAERTIILDIGEIKSEFEPFIEIDSNHLGYTLKIYDLDSYLQLKRELIQNEPLFIILESVFHGKLYSIDEWSDKLFISPTSIIRYLDKLKTTFDEYDLKIKQKPLNFIGDELNIRKFFLDFYYVSDVTPHSVFPSETIKDIAKNIYSNSKIAENNSMTFLELSYILYIVAERSNQGYGVQLPKKLVEIYLESKNLDQLNEYFYKIKLDRLSNDERAYIFFLICSKRTLVQEKELEFVEKFEHYFDPSVCIDNFLNNYRDFTNNIEIDNIFVRSFVLSTILKTLISPVYNKNIIDFTSDSIEYNSTEYDKVLPIFSASFQCLTKNKYYKEIISNFLRVRQSVRDIYWNEKKTVLFLLEGDLYVRQNIEAKAIKYLNFHKLFFIDKINYDRFINKHTVDVIVTNYIEYVDELSQAKCILFKSIPDINDWQHLLIRLDPNVVYEFQIKK